MTRCVALSLALLALTGCGGDAAEPRIALPPVVATAHAEAWVDKPDRIADVAERAVEAVVFIQATKRLPASAVLPFGFPPGLVPDARGPMSQGVGSGVIVDPSGVILTNHHVVDGADELDVTLADGRRFRATVRGSDPGTDLAAIQLQGDLPDALPALPFGDSDTARLGEVVLAIGAPFALRGSVTMGIISARGRAMGVSDYEDYIQTDAAINPGNSGGALVDLRGQLIGINTLIRSPSGGNDGVGFAVPANLARQVLARLLSDGRVVRGFLGVGIQDIDPSFADRFGLEAGGRGALVNEVQDGSAAARAGLAVGDVIVAVGGAPVRDANTLRNSVSIQGAGAEVELTVLREGRSRTLRATLAALPGAPDVGTSDAQAPEGDALLGGVLLDDGPRANGSQAPGAVVRSVDPNAPAARAGLRTGDVIVEVERRPTPDAKAVQRALRGTTRAMVLIDRDGARRFLFLESSR